jgi:hypothetical protein
VVCPCFAMVCPESQRLDLARSVQASDARVARVPNKFLGVKSRGSTRHIVMPFIP